VNESALTGGRVRPVSRRRTAPRPFSQPPALDLQPPATAQRELMATSGTLEAHCLGVLMRQPDLVFRVDRLMQEYGLPRLGQSDFERAEHQAIFDLVEESLDQDVAEPLHMVINGLPFPMMEKADDLLSRTENLDLVEERVLEDLLRALLNLRILNVQESLEHYYFLLEEAQQARDQEQIKDYLKIVQQFTQMRGRLDQALGRFTSRSFDAKVKES